MIYIDHTVEGMEGSVLPSMEVSEVDLAEPTPLLYFPDGSVLLDEEHREPIGFRPPDED